MFIGIVEELGYVVVVEFGVELVCLMLCGLIVVVDVVYGVLIVVNGVCFIVVEYDVDCFIVDVMLEMLCCSVLG